MNIEVTQKADGWMLGTIEGGYEWQANLGLQEIERTYSSRVHSRLAGMYAVVQFRGRDIRLQKKQEG